MKITVQQGKEMKFSEIIVGQVFMYNGSVYMKTISMLDKHSDDSYNAIYLSNGEPFLFSHAEMIEPLEAELKVWR